jgi:hypothetical protein
MRFLLRHQLIIQVRLPGQFGVTGENEIMSAICCASAAAANNFIIYFFLILISRFNGGIKSAEKNPTCVL